MTDYQAREVCTGVLAMAGDLKHLIEQRKRFGGAAKKLIDAGETTGREGDGFYVPAAVWMEFAAATSDLPEILKPNGD